MDSAAATAFTFLFLTPPIVVDEIPNTLPTIPSSSIPLHSLLQSTPLSNPPIHLGAESSTKVDTFVPASEANSPTVFIPY